MSQKCSDCVIVVPTHKPVMAPEEERSFRNTLEVLWRWDVALMLPCHVPRDYYEALREELGLQFRIIAGQPGWLGSIERYNDMALSPEFYRTFQQYRYVLICHLDAWVFRDEIQAWVDRGYDYIGAPWFLTRERGYAPLEKLMCPQGGNGGFSLRNVGKMIELTSKRHRALNLPMLFNGVVFLLRNRRFDYLKIFIRSCYQSLWDVDAFRNRYNVYEDALISIFYSWLDRRFRVAPAKEAIFFATEVNSEEIIETGLGFQLPFAIHGYDKYLSGEAMERYRNDIRRNCYTQNLRIHGAEGGGRNKMPLVSIVTATYNIIESGRVETFRQCMESVHKQTYSNVEHIIIDGASSDGTLELIREYVGKGWCVCYSEKDQGVWDAMFKGHQRAQGEFVNYMNSDDYFLRNDAVEIAVNAMRKAQADWFFSGGIMLDEDGSVSTFPTSLYGVFNCMGILHQSMYVRTDILRAINPFQSQHVTRENYLMLMLCANGFRHAYANESLVCYRQGGFSLTEYCTDISRTHQDFGMYLYNSIGRFWGMTEDECSSMFAWRCFHSIGVWNSYRLSRKLKMRGLRRAFRVKLIKYTVKHKTPGLLSKMVLLRVKRRLRSQMHIGK